MTRFMVKEGEYVPAGEPFAEIEVMKMLLSLKNSLSGKITFRAAVGTNVVAGQILAEIQYETLNCRT